MSGMSAWIFVLYFQMLYKKVFFFLFFFTVLLNNISLDYKSIAIVINDSPVFV